MNREHDPEAVADDEHAAEDDEHGGQVHLPVLVAVLHVGPGPDDGSARKSFYLFPMFSSTVVYLFWLDYYICAFFIHYFSFTLAVIAL